MVDGTLLAVLFVGFIIAALRDIQVREVPDTVSLGLIVIGLLGGLLIAIVRADVWLFLEHLFGFLAGAAMGLAMYYLRQWGGGDAKLIMGTGAVLGLARDNLQLPEFVVLLVLVGAVYGLLYTIGLALAHRKAFGPAFVEELRTPRVHRLRIALVVSGVALAALFVAVQDAGTRLLIGLALACAYFLTYMWVFIRVVEKALMVKPYPVGKLTEGDWIAQDVTARGKVLVSRRTPGITLEQIAALKRARVRTVVVRERIPFVPSFLLALIALLALERWLAPMALSLLSSF